MVGVILAAGDGRRLKESSKEDCCKPLIKLKGKRLIEYALDNLVDLDITQAYIVVGREGDLIKKNLGERYKSIKLFYVIQEQQKGLMNAFVQAISCIGSDKSVVLQLSDEIFIDLKIGKIRKTIATEKYDFYCGVTNEDDAEKIKNNFSVATDDEGNMTGCVEKPVEIINNIKGTGFCIFSSRAVQMLSEKYAESLNINDLCDYMNFLISESQKGFALHIAEKEFNINTFSDLYEVQTYFE